MFRLVFWVTLALFFMGVQSGSLGKKDESSEEQKKKEIRESIKEFVKMVDKYNLNVTIIGSKKVYGSEGWVKEDVAVAIHMPSNDERLTEATLDDDKMDKYITKMKRIANKEKVAVATRVVKIEDGEDKSMNGLSHNKKYLIHSPAYEFLTHYKDGVQGFSAPENVTGETLYNYLIEDPNDSVKNIQVITGNVIVEELDKSDDFPEEVIEEIKKILPKLWMSIEDDIMFARLLGQHLDKQFTGGNFQIVTGVQNFALPDKKFAQLKVADSNVLVFYL